MKFTDRVCQSCNFCKKNFHDLIKNLEKVYYSRHRIQQATSFADHIGVPASPFASQKNPELLLGIFYELAIQ